MTPWWIGTSWYSINYDTSWGAGAREVDLRNGRPIFQFGRPPSGTYYYGDEVDKDYFENKNGQPLGVDDSGYVVYWPLRQIEIVPDQDSLAPVPAFFPNVAAPYGNLGVGVAIVNGQARYAKYFDNANDAALLMQGAVGIYGGAQRVTWRSPSQSSATVVSGPGGGLYVAFPADASFGENDTADHTTTLQGIWRDFGPIITAAITFGTISGVEFALPQFTTVDALISTAKAAIESALDSSASLAVDADFYGNLANTAYSLPDVANVASAAASTLADASQTLEIGAEILSDAVSETASELVASNVPPDFQFSDVLIPTSDVPYDMFPAPADGVYDVLPPAPAYDMWPAAPDAPFALPPLPPLSTITSAASAIAKAISGATAATKAQAARPVVAALPPGFRGPVVPPKTPGVSVALGGAGEQTVGAFRNIQPVDIIAALALALTFTR